MGALAGAVVTAASMTASRMGVPVIVTTLLRTRLLEAPAGGRHETAQARPSRIASRAGAARYTRTVTWLVRLSGEMSVAVMASLPWRRTRTL